MLPLCLRSASAIMRRSSSAIASAMVSPCMEASAAALAAAAALMGVTLAAADECGTEVRINSGERLSGVMVVPSSARATTL
jgi:hypothetical protein